MEQQFERNDVVLVRVAVAGSVIETAALVARSVVAVPSMGGKPVLGADNAPVPAEELLDVVLLGPAGSKTAGQGEGIVELLGLRPVKFVGVDEKPLGYASDIEFDAHPTTAGVLAGTTPGTGYVAGEGDVAGGQFEIVQPAGTSDPSAADLDAVAGDEQAKAGTGAAGALEGATAGPADVAAGQVETAQ